MLIVDNDIKVYFTHHLFNEKAQSITRKGSDVYYYDILNYVKEKWLKRTLNMTNEEPVFIYDDNATNPTHLYTNTDLSNFKDLPYKKLIITNNVSLKNYENDGLMIMEKKSGIVDTNILSKRILNDNNILEFLSIS